MVYIAGINYNRHRLHEADKTQIESFFADIQPSRGSLVPLRTLAEVQSSPQLEDAYIVRVPVKAANALSMYTRSPKLLCIKILRRKSDSLHLESSVKPYHQVP